MSGTRVAPHVFVIMGITGDLAHRKLLPALQALDAQGRLPDRFFILGAGRRDLEDDALRERARRSLVEAGASGEDARRWCGRRLFYQRLAGDDYSSLARRVEAFEAEQDLPGNRVFYMALPPSAFQGHVDGLGRAGLVRGPGFTRLVVEKPFGRDLPSARRLNALLHAHFEEKQLYRIDHYLGKDTVQNLLTFRFANPLFESAWNRDRVESVEITSIETLGIEGRAGYYEDSGASRDMVQNHLTQVLALMAMEPPASFAAGPVRNEKIKVLEAIDPIRHADAVFGQYAAGHIGGRKVPGYREEPNVSPTSRTETYVAMRLHVANWRWQGVPFYLRAGKRLGRRITQAAVTFRKPPVCLFKSLGVCETHSNVLLITLQPDEGFSLYFDVKEPGDAFRLRTLPLRFRYAEEFDSLADGYQTLLLDVMRGDQTLFVHADETEAAWRLYASLLDGSMPVHEYAAGGVGPIEAEALLAHGHRWQDI
ncbi:MAG: glucose-6-phosphate dehydrogenase [Vicinamibacteria bacterium]|nr:glucose-6-phosphate dehydrogenase [Vicinamibacteria bacterium]